MFSPSIKQKKQIADLCNSINVNFCVLFGSQVSGKTHRGSDFDIGLYPDENLPENTATIEHELSVILHHPDVQTVNVKIAGPLLQKEIASNGKVLYARDENVFPLFQMAAMRAYYDFEPYLKMRKNLIHSRIKTL